MVEDIVREFVPEALVTDLDLSRLQRLNSRFHTGRRSARRREGDVIWRLPTCGRGGTSSDLYLSIEFQSESDWWMAVRTQVYQGLLWQQIIDERRLKAGERLPPLILIVLYNGARRWSAPTETAKLITLSPTSALWPWQPQVCYRLLDMGAFTTAELAQRTSLAALLFRLEQPPRPEEFPALLEEVIGWFRRHPGLERLQRLFAELIRKATAGFGLELSAIEDLLEMKTMLSMLAETWKQQWLAEGKAEGKVEGKAEGKAEALVCLLTERFGPLTPPVQRRIRAANLRTVETWFKRAIVAPDLPSVFAPRR
jgi:hypothetical protein